MATHSLHKTTLLPPQTDPSLALSILHDHKAMLHLNPLIETSDLLPADTTLAPHLLFPIPWANSPESAPIYQVSESLNGGKGIFYNVMDKIGMGKVSFKARMQNKDDGLRTDVEAALGFRSFVEWKVRKATTEEVVGDAGAVRYVLEENSTIAAAWVLVQFAKPTLEDAHEKLHEAFLVELAKRQKEMSGAMNNVL